jgi:hypothetical protein
VRKTSTGRDRLQHVPAVDHVERVGGDVLVDLGDLELDAVQLLGRRALARHVELHRVHVEADDPAARPDPTSEFQGHLTGSAAHVEARRTGYDVTRSSSREVVPAQLRARTRSGSAPARPPRIT